MTDNDTTEPAPTRDSGDLQADLADLLGVAIPDAEHADRDCYCRVCWLVEDIDQARNPIIRALDDVAALAATGDRWGAFASQHGEDITHYLTEADRALRAARALAFDAAAESNDQAEGDR